MEAQNHSATRRTPWPLLAWLAVLPTIFLVFYPALQGSFLLDDSTGIIGNSEFREFSVRNIINLFRNHRDVRAYDHHPVPGFTALVDYQWSGVDPFGYHLSNFFFHWFTAGAFLLVFLEVRKRMATQRGEEFDLRLASWMGGAAVLIWAVHPYATMATGYITNRQETLMVLFYLLSIWALLRDREGWSLILAVTSFLSKEVAVTLPGALWLVDWAGGGKGIIETFRRRARFYGVLTTVWLFLCYWHAKGGRTGHVTITGMPLATPIEYFKAEMYVIVEYFWKLVVPVKLQFYPYIRAVSSWQQWVPWLVLIVAYIGLAVYSLRWSRWLAVVLVFPLLVLSPTSTVIPIPFEPKMEYRFYLPAAALIGLFTIAVWKHVRPVWAKAVVLGTVFVVMATLSHLRSRDYTDNIRLFEQQVSVDPGSLTGLEALSMAYMNKGMMERAEATAWKIVDWSLEQKANDFAGRGFNLLGIIADDRRDYAKAKDFFQRSIGIAGSIQAKVNLAQVHVRLYELEEGEKLLQEILAVQPDAPMALLLMFEAQMSGKKYDQAEKLLDKIIAFFPEKAAELDIQRTRLMNLRRKEESAKP